MCIISPSCGGRRHPNIEIMLRPTCSSWRASRAFHARSSPARYVDIDKCMPAPTVSGLPDSTFQRVHERLAQRTAYSSVCQAVPNAYAVSKKHVAIKATASGDSAQLHCLISEGATRRPGSDQAVQPSGHVGRCATPVRGRMQRARWTTVSICASRFVATGYEQRDAEGQRARREEQGPSS